LLEDQEEYLRHVETHPEARARMRQAESCERSSSRQAPMCPAIGLPPAVINAAGEARLRAIEHDEPS
jgi:hypothetical protein